MFSLRAAASGIALTSAVCLSMPIAAQNDEIERGPVPDWVTAAQPLEIEGDPRGIVFVRNQDTQVHFDASGQTYYQGSRMKLLNANALQAGNIAIGWNPAAGAPTVHTLAIHRDGSRIDVLDTSQFTVLRREDQLETSMINGLLTASLQVPDLRIGDELEITYSVPSSDPTLGNTDSGLLFLADAPPPGRYRLGLSWEEGYAPNVRLTPDFESIATRHDNAILIDMDMPKAVTPPKDAPPRYAWNRIVQYTDFESWEAVSRRFDTLFEAAATVPDDSPVAREAQRIMQAHATPAARAAAALELVQQQVRYVYVGLNEGNLTPVSAEETWQRRYGDCKAKTALLLALLSRLDIPAEAVLASNAGLDDGLDQRLPSPALFDHVLVRANVDGQELWMDGTHPSVSRASRTPVAPYRWVLPLSGQGSGLDRVEWQPDAAPRELVAFDLDASAGFDQPARIVNTTVNTGLKALQEYMQFSSVTDDQLTQAYRNRAIGDGFWESIDTVEWSFDEDHQASVLTIAGTGRLEWEETGESGRYMTLPGGGFSPPTPRIRDAGQDQEAPYWRETTFDCRFTTVRLPEETLEENWTYNSAFATEMFGESYLRAFERADGEIRMMRLMRTEQPEISAAAARRDNERIAAFDNSMARIEWDPDHRSSTRVAGSVASAHDTSWDTLSQACASAL